MDFARLAKQVEKELIATRRDLHAHPEYAFKEFRTALVIERRLKSLGIKTRRMAGTGVVGDLDVAGARKRVALRADIDALPITEKTGLPFASQTPGMMHACGHDANTAILLAAARIIAENRRGLKGGVRFMFQPSEEFPPGGARAMVREGVMRGVDEIYGLHLWSEAPSGKVIAEPGPRMANVDDVRVKIVGKGAHGASPHFSVDPVLTAAEAIVALQQIVSRNIAPTEPAVISICMINAGTAYNVIPPECDFRGTVRTFSKALRRRMPRMIARVVTGIAKAHGAAAKVEYLAGYDALVNDGRATACVRAAAEQLFGAKALAHLGLKMGAEDFSEYMKLARGCYFGIGIGNAKKGTDAPHHNPNFKVDESVLWMGAAMMAKIAWERSAAG